MGGCKHALEFLMWINEKSSQPAPTDVETYWNKPKLLNISSNAVLRTKDFGDVELAGPVDVKGFLTQVLAPPQPSLSAFQRYNSEPEAVSSLDLYQLCLRYVNAKENKESMSALDFRNFCTSSMDEALCEAAREMTKGQQDSQHWHFLRYGRISESNIHTAANTKKETGGILKEIILGASTLHLSRAMKRGLLLESQVLEILKKELKIQIWKVGIQLCPEYPEFGASPDGLSDDYVVTIKCPLTEKTFKNVIQDGDIVSPKFMAKMQLQMKLYKRSKGLFCVARPNFETSKEVKIVYVDFDEKLTSQLLRRARAHWDKHIYPLLVSSASS